jgi:YfiH family protein
MEPSDKKIELIRPEILNYAGSIQAWFTCKNAEFGAKNQTVPGLNFGFNTNEQKEIVEQHREELLSALNIDAEKIAYAEQVHGNKIKVVTKGGIYKGVDALLTKTPGLALAIQVADCAAILLADSERGVIAAVHAGWRGAAGNILPNTLKKMKSVGAQASNLRAFISPCISQAHFEVGAEVAEKFPAEFVDYQNYSKPHVDLKSILNRQLLEQGLKKENIEVHEGCTVDNSKQFYSYRREQQQSGRMLGLIRLDN